MILYAAASATVVFLAVIALGAAAIIGIVQLWETL